MDNELSTAASIAKDLIGNVSDQDAKFMTCVINAAAAVKEYVRKDTINNIDVAELFPYQIAQLAFYYYKSFDDMNIQSKSQGNRSITYGAKGIPDDIKKSLPRYATGF